MANRLADTLGTAAPAASPAFATALATARATAPLAAAFALALAIPLSGCASPSQTNAPDAERAEALIVRDREAAPAEAAIDADAAARAALEHAGLSEQDVEGLTVELDSEGGATAYEVEFHVRETEYDYDVDAVTGEVLGFEMAAD